MRITIKGISILTLHIFLIISAYLMINAPIPESAYGISSLFILLFILPSVLAAVRWLGVRDAVVLISILGGFALAIEGFGIVTGIPYGEFRYSDRLGYKLFGFVPWTVAFAWTPLMLAAFAVAAQLVTIKWLRIIVVAGLLAGFDLVLDPGAVGLGFWSFANKGWYYEVPYTNYLGWIISGLMGGTLLEFVVSRFRPLLPVPVQLMRSGFLTLFFWTFIALFSGMLIPAGIGVVLLVFLAAVYRKSYYRFDEMVVLVDEENIPVGTAPKLPVHGSNTPLHRAFSVFLFNSRGELLLQRRAIAKKTWGGIWSNSCCGHLMLHENVKAAAKRRLWEELGLTRIELKVILPDYRYRAEKDGIVENEICPVLIGFTDRAPVLNPEEVAEYRWEKWEDFLSSANDPGSQLSPWAIEEANLLEQDEEFKKVFSDRAIQ